MKAPICVGETTGKHSTGQVLALRIPGQVGVKSWMGRVCGFEGNLGSSPQGWLPKGPDSR